jgi:hypothetical protein
MASLATAGLLLAGYNVGNAAQREPLTGPGLSESSETRSQATKTEKSNLEPQPQVRGASPCTDRRARVCVDLSANRTWLLHNGRVVYGPVRITHGRAGHATPVGTFKVLFKSKFHRSRLFNWAPMPNSVFFHRGIAFHQGNLRNQSHGCIRLSPGASEVYFNTLRVGDVVQVVR